MKERVKELIAEFKRRLCDSDKCPSDSALRTYSYSIAWLMDRMEFPEKGMPKVERVLEYMNNAKVSAQRKCQVYTALKKWHGCHGEECECKGYGKPLVEAKVATDRAYYQQKRTEKQKKNWVDFPVIKQFANFLRDEVLEYDKHNMWEKEQFIKAQLAFILQFHMKYPLRRELATVRWGKKEWGEKDNYLDPQNKTIVLRSYKTSRWMGETTFRLTRVMWRIWALLRKQQQKRGITGGHILVSKYYRAMSPNGFSSWLKREMKRCPGCEKKAVGCMLIRHCCITWERRNEKTNPEKAEYAKKCLHSQKTNDQYRVHA